MTWRSVAWVEVIDEEKIIEVESLDYGKSYRFTITYGRYRFTGEDYTNPVSAKMAARNKFRMLDNHMHGRKRRKQ